MTKDDLEKVRRLSPEERIRKLREITQKDEEEIKKAQDIIKESESEIEEIEKEKRQIPIPQMRSVDVSTLFGRGTQEEEVFKAKRFVVPRREEESGVEAAVGELKGAKAKELEEIAARERTSREAEEESRRQQYGAQAIRYEPIGRVTERLGEIQNSLYSAETKEEKERLLGELYSIRTGTAQKLSDIQDGSYSSEASNQAVLTYKTAKQLMDKYKA